MKIWIERALAGIRLGWDKLVVFGNGVYDPPPRARKWFFFTALALFASGWLTFAFVNSWFYRPTVEFLATLGDDGDVFLPDHMEPLPSVATPAVPVPSVEVVCHDMSDTPHCEPVLPPESGSGGKVEVSDIPPPVAKPPVGYKAKKSPAGYKRRKHQPYQTYWGF